jgi:LacI family transcriptional regulator
MRRPTQEDVAKIAGVSRATVSYIINNRTGGNIQITEETRNRVLDAIKILGYQPNVQARSLRTQKTNLIAVMVSDLTNQYYPLLFRGAQEVFHEGGYQILVFDSNNLAKNEFTFVEMMLQWRVDGVIMVPFHLEESDIGQLSQANIRVVTIHGEIGKSGGNDNIQPEEGKAIFELISHLKDKGHQRIAHLAGSQETPPGKIRFRAYRDSLKNLGIPYDDSLVYFGAFRRREVKELIKANFLTHHKSNLPTALFAANDIMAIEAIRTLTSMGLRVPEDIAVCGFDNIPEANIIEPSLTTIDQFPQALGRQAAKLLIERLDTDQNSEPKIIKSGCQVVLRESA